MAARRLRERVAQIEQGLPEGRAHGQATGAPVLFFNASTRLNTLSLNAAFSLVSAWALRMRGHDVGYVVCHQGMRQCVLGTRWRRPHQPPPCASCIEFSQGLYPSKLTHPIGFDWSAAAEVEASTADRTVEQLAQIEHAGLPLGELCLPSLRWALRLHDVPDDTPSRYLFRQYVQSAASLARQIERVLERERPQALVVFNGITYPEAVARAVAQRRGVPVITHEVGLRPQSAYFSHEEATFRQVQVPQDAGLSPAERDRLERYIDARRQGDFSMAGIRFWQAVDELPPALTEAAREFQRVITVFTNVVFDTSQVHANVIFDNMFQWLDWLHGVIKARPDTLFVIRAHPDEDRAGKAARQSVEGWAARRGVTELANVFFVPADSPISSYKLMQISDLCLIYNSSIGLEAAIAGLPVLAAGRARFTQANVVVLPESLPQYESLLTGWFNGERVSPPPGFEQRARAFLNRELYAASIDFSAFIEPEPYMPGMVRLKAFEPDLLLHSEDLQVVVNGIVNETAFELPTEPTGRAVA